MALRIFISPHSAPPFPLNVNIFLPIQLALVTPYIFGFSHMHAIASLLLTYNSLLFKFTCIHSSLFSAIFSPFPFSLSTYLTICHPINRDPSLIPSAFSFLPLLPVSRPANTCVYMYPSSHFCFHLPVNQSVSQPFSHHSSFRLSPRVSSRNSKSLY